jgi:conjugal transfer ATP-binding protein TraC
VYRAAGWDLLDDRYLQIQGLLAAMPMTMANGLSFDLKNMKRMRTVLTTTAASLMPLQGEYLGGLQPHLMLVGRRGQPFFWSPFENTAGNHNVAVCGKSGSGKSVALQELCASMVGAGAKVVVIDDGRSFEHSAKLQGGAFVEFTMASGFCINPFAMIDPELAGQDEDYLMDCFAMLKSIVNQMARHIDKLNDTERGLIDGAINKVWAAKGRSGCIDDVIAALEETGNPVATDLGIAMRPFSSAGTYGRFFTGDVSFQLKANLTVFELSDLSSREELRSVALTAIMFMASQAMRREDRSVPKALLLDEAWQMLKGGSMADFIEAYARTCRKYGASLVTATQSINDYYKSDGSKAALENSDWFVVLQQKAETIADFKKHDRFEMDDYTDALMRSLKRNGVEYSDVLIKGPESMAVGRLVLDPYSATVFSSSPRIVGEYVQAQARSATPPDQVQAQMRTFMAALDTELQRRGAAGQVVLVGEAVLSKSVPDITGEVAKAVYSTGVRVPQPASPAQMGAMMRGQAPTAPVAAPVAVAPEVTQIPTGAPAPSPFGAVGMDTAQAVPAPAPDLSAAGASVSTFGGPSGQ